MTTSRKVVLWLVVSVLVATGAAVATMATVAQTVSAGPELPAEKQKIVDDEAAALKAAQQNAAPKSQVLQQVFQRELAAPRLAARESGLVDMHQGPFRGSEFYVANFWQGPVGGQWLLVYAGGPRDDDGTVTQGGLRVYTEPTDPNVGSDLSYIGEYVSTSSAGALELVSVHGNLATLQSPNGETVVFDFGTKRFR